MGTNTPLLHKKRYYTINQNEINEAKSSTLPLCLANYFEQLWSAHLCAEFLMYPPLVDSRSLATPMGDSLINPLLLL